MHFNHRVLRHVRKADEWFSVHEVYYDDDGTPTSCTSEPIQLIQEEFKDIEWEIDKIKDSMTESAYIT